MLLIKNFFTRLAYLVIVCVLSEFQVNITFKPVVSYETTLIIVYQKNVTKTNITVVPVANAQ